MTNGHLTVTLAGVEHKVVMPRSFADLEDLKDGWNAAKDVSKSRRIYGATVALCVPGAVLGVRVADFDTDLRGLGKAAYDYLRSGGAKPAEIEKAASACFKLVLEALFPRATEVAKAEVFSEGEGPTT